MYIPRAITTDMLQHTQPGKIVVLYGPRRVGKTTLITEIAKFLKGKILWLNGETTQAQEALQENSIKKLADVIKGYDVVIIDEGQKIPEIGWRLKLMVDSFPELRIIATGSSSFDLANQVGEPIVGRKWSYTLYPIAQMELLASGMQDFLKTEERLEDRLIFGSYPDLFTRENRHEKRDYLNELLDGALFKDLFELEGMKNAQKIRSICRLLAYQVGQEVSISELAHNVELSRGTIYKYLELLEKVFVVRRIGGYSRNLRSEIKKYNRYYFLDNGIMNALTGNFNQLDAREDIGRLWENFIVTERIKWLTYTKTYRNVYFWRTHEQQEIDWVEEGDGKLLGYEISWRNEKKRMPPLWKKTYPNGEFSIIHKDNYINFITQ